MAFVLLRILYGLYFFGTAVIFYHLISTLVFKRDGLEEAAAFERVLLLFFWPLAFFSPSGRQKLKKLKENF